MNFFFFWGLSFLAFNCMMDVSSSSNDLWVDFWEQNIGMVLKEGKEFLI